MMAEKMLAAPSNANAGSDYACKMCSRRFANLQECLKHDLLDHSLSKARPQKALRTQLQAVLLACNDEANQRMQQALNDCEEGQELQTILQLNCVDTTKLEQAYRRIYNCLNKELRKLGNFSIYPFGSVANGLALESSDIDLYIESANPEDHGNKRFRQLFGRVSSFLFRSVCFADVVPIRQARVPIIKCKHVPTGFSIDINMSCPSSVNNTNFLRDLILCDTRIHQTMLFLKIWAKHLQIVGRGHMSSYCLITLIIFYLQNTFNAQRRTALVASMNYIQKNLAPVMVEGVNYAYTTEQLCYLAKEHTVRSLISGFFCFYHKYDFMQNIVSPYQGRTISREQFTACNGQRFKVYTQQLETISEFKGAAATTLPLEHCMCVQDIFCLNLNVARSVRPPSFQYLRNSLQCAADVCCDKSIVSDAQFYKMLMYGVLEKMSKLEEPIRGTESTNCTSTALSCKFTPNRLEMRTICMHLDTIDNSDKSLLFKLWIKLYIEVIKEILTDIYMFELQVAVPTHSLKNQKLENSELTRAWVLHGSVDMWSGRMFEGKTNMQFMEQQKRITALFQEQRRQAATYAVQFDGLLTLNILDNYTAIELKLQPTDASVGEVGKKNPLRKFFANFKSGMQNFNIKEKLQTTDVQNVNLTENSTVESLKCTEKQAIEEFQPLKEGFEVLQQ